MEIKYLNYLLGTNLKYSIRSSDTSCRGLEALDIIWSFFCNDETFLYNNNVLCLGL